MVAGVEPVLVTAYSLQPLQLGVADGVGVGVGVLGVDVGDGVGVGVGAIGDVVPVNTPYSWIVY